MLVVSFLEATSIQTTKDIYLPQESIQVNVTEMSGDKKDWVALFSVGSDNSWENVLKWNWTGGIVNGKLTLGRLPQGDYEARAFFKNSYTLEASYPFKVEGAVLSSKVETDKVKYQLNEEVKISFSNMLGDSKDWIGIYPSGSSNAWEKVVAWKYTKGLKEGNLSFSNLSTGKYDVRAFFQNSFNLEANSSFSIEQGNIEKQSVVSLTLSKESYNPNELIIIDYDKMQGNESDWIGIYPAGSSYAFSNVVDWKYLKGKISGSLSLNGIVVAGDYEVRAFFNNSLKKEAVASFTVADIPATSTLYEDAEDNVSKDWIHVAGKYDMKRITPGFESEGAVRFKAYWLDGGTYNPTEFHLPLNNSKEKFLEIDMRARNNPHFNFGLIVTTKQGKRIVIWDSFFNHNGEGRTIIPAHIKKSNGNIILNNPAPSDYHYSGSRNTFRHFKINVEKTIRNLEPDNEIISIDKFITTGGEYDNIKLSSY